MIGRALALSLALSAPALAAEPRPSIKGPSRVLPGGTIVLDATASVSDKPLKWKYEGPNVPYLVLDQAGRAGVYVLVPNAEPGTYRFTLIARGKPTGEDEIDADAAVFVVYVAAPAPIPTPPAPSPTPAPPPAPTPAPPAPPGPTPTDRLRVLFLNESSAGATRDQATAWASTKIRAYLTSRCMVDADARPAWRFLDRDADVSGQSAGWQAAFAAAKAEPTALPKMVVFAGDAKPVAFPLRTESEALSTLQLYGGH